MLATANWQHSHRPARRRRRLVHLDDARTYVYILTAAATRFVLIFAPGQPDAVKKETTDIELTNTDNLKILKLAVNANCWHDRCDGGHQRCCALTLSAMV